MGRTKRSQSLYVYMNATSVGILQQKLNGELNFKYDITWLQWAYARPISLSMPLTDKEYSGTIVYNFFDNLLPDNRLIRERIQKRFTAQTNSAFDLLDNIGADCVGALQLLSQPLEQDIENNINGAIMNNSQISELLKHYKTAPLGMQNDSDFRISIAGAQEKTALLKIKNKWYLPKGITPTTHIIKLPIGKIEHANIDLSKSVENEWLCINILHEFGLPTPEVAIVDFLDIRTLVVTRFDRVWNVDQSAILRIPQEDMCQAMGISSGLKYESDGGPGINGIMDLLQGSVNTMQDRYNFMKAVFVFWIMGAIDGHAKNFSISLEQGGNYKLTPFYDVISAYPFTVKRELEFKKIKMAMAVLGKNKHYKLGEITIRHWYDTAEVCKFPADNMKQIIEEVLDQMDLALEKVANRLPVSFPMGIFVAISTQMQTLRNHATRTKSKIN